MKYKLSPLAKSLGYLVESYDSVGSTNIIGIQRAKDGLVDRLWVVADEQTHGRARLGRSWHSPKGNLYTSLLLIDEITPESAAYLGFVAGVSMVEAIKHHISKAGHQNITASLKWPNDILLNNAKASGILLELIALKDNKSALVIGIGMNVQHHFKDAPYLTESLRSVGLDIEPQELFTSLTHFWAENYNLFKEKNGTQLIHKKWLSHVAFLGKPIHVVTHNTNIDGVFMGIDEKYNCIVKMDDGSEEKITAGDIHFN